jgi:hypothetical protein
MIKLEGYGAQMEEQMMKFYNTASLRSTRRIIGHLVAPTQTIHMIIQIIHQILLVLHQESWKEVIGPYYYRIYDTYIGIIECGHIHPMESQFVQLCKDIDNLVNDDEDEDNIML